MMISKVIIDAMKCEPYELKSFIRFLISNDAYFSYLSNVENHYNKNGELIVADCFLQSLKERVERLGNMSQILVWSFQWSHTPEGSTFWFKLHNKWSSLYYNEIYPILIAKDESKVDRLYR